MKNVLVTGGTGFIGSNLAAALIREGYSVRVLRRPESDMRALGDLKVESCLGDLRNPASIREAVKGCDTVFHTAAMISYWRKERPLMGEINVGGTRTIVEACLEAGVKRLIHTSSTAAIGFPASGGVADESVAYNWHPYDVGYRNSKHAAEEEVHRGVSLGLDAVLVNPSIVIGPRDIHFHGGQLIRDVYRKKIFYYISGMLNVTYVDDVVQGHLSAARLGRKGERYILCGETLTRKEVLTTIAEVVGGIPPLFKVPTPMIRLVTAGSELVSAVAGKKPWISSELMAGNELEYRLSSHKAESELGYTITPFREAVRRTFDWYRLHGYL